MSAETSPNSIDWQSRLARAVVSIELERNSQRTWDYGTGFFVTESIVLTACHNLESEVDPAIAKKDFKAMYRDGKGKAHELLGLRWLDNRSSPKSEHDIAVLEYTGTLPPNLCPLPVGLLPEDGPVDSKRNKEILTGKAVAIFGYPTRGKRMEARFIDGSFYKVQPLKPACLTHHGTGKVSESWTIELVVEGENADELPGISGAPIVHVESGCVIGIQHAYNPRRARKNTRPGAHLVYGSPLNLFLDGWPSFIADCKATRLGAPTDKARLEALRDKLAKHFEGLARTTLKESGREAPVLQLLQCPPPNSLDSFLEAVSADVDSACERLFEAIRLAAEQARSEILGHLTSIADLVLPWAIPASLWERIRHGREHDEGVGAAAGVITAEAIAAGTAGAPMCVERESDGNARLPFLKSDTAWDAPPGEPTSGPYQAVVAQLWQDLGIPASNVPTVAGMLKQLQTYYARETRRKGRPPYIVIKLPEQGRDRELWLEALAELRREMVHVQIIERVDDDELHALEGDLWSRWLELHPEFKPRGGTTDHG